MATIFPTVTRQPGTVDNQANPTAVPAGAAGKTWFCQVQAAQADLDDPTVTFGLQMFAEDPTAPTGWRFSVGITFVGGPNQGKGGTATVAPGWLQDGNAVANKNVYFELDNTGRAVALGLTAVAQ